MTTVTKFQLKGLVILNEEVFNREVFFDRRKEDGLEYVIGLKSGINDAAASYYRWEPLPTRLLGAEGAELRREIKAREKPGAERGILRVSGPLYREGRIWLGWELRSGEALFSATRCEKSGPLPLSIRQLSPLVHSYFSYHEAGLIVGTPVWGRVYLDEEGIYMPDPRSIRYLPKPALPLLPGLRGCWPPELYNGAELDSKGDLYYLGLMIYTFLTGRLPYDLERGWPTRSILQGGIIPPTVFRPELSPTLACLMTALLSPAPDGRPQAIEVKDLWDRFLKEPSSTAGRDLLSNTGYLATAVQMKDHLRKKKAYIRDAKIKCYYGIFKSISKWVLPLGLTLCLLFTLMINRRVVSTDPVVEAREFYQRLTQAHQGTQVNEAEISREFLQAGEERRRLAAELLTRPLFEVRALNLVKTSRDDASQVVLEAELIWWEWTGAEWGARLSRERLRLRKKDRGWQVIQRAPVLLSEELRRGL